MASSQDNIYIAEGVKEDCLSLIHKFSENQTYSFEKFLEIWKETKFSYIYLLKNNYPELLEFTEEVFFIIKNLWLSEKDFIKSLGAFYTLIGLYRKQPTRNVVKIRLVLKDLQLIREFIKSCIDKELTEVVFMYKELKKDEAFIYVASEHQYGLDSRYKKYFSSIPEIDILTESPKLNSIANKLPQSILKYLESKNELIENNKDLSSWINLLSGDKIKETISKLSNLTNLDKDIVSKIEKTLQCAIQEEDIHGIARRKIKKEAFVKDVNKSKCRTSSDKIEYQNEKIKKPETERLIDNSKSKKRFLRNKLKYSNKVCLNQTSNTNTSDKNFILDSFKKKINVKFENNDNDHEIVEGNVKILEELYLNERKTKRKKMKAIQKNNIETVPHNFDLSDIPSTSKGVIDWSNSILLDCDNSDSSD